LKRMSFMPPPSWESGAKSNDLSNLWVLPKKPAEFRSFTLLLTGVVLALADQLTLTLFKNKNNSP